MTIKPLTLACLGAVAATLFTGTAIAQESAKKDYFATPGEVAKTKAFMRQKVLYSANVLEGLALEKFDLVVDNAQLLRNMTQSNLFFRVRNPEYMKQTKKFSKSVDKLIIAGHKKSLKDATKALNKVTESCVDCHRWFRKEQRKAPPERKAPVLLINPPESGK